MPGTEPAHPARHRLPAARCPAPCAAITDAQRRRARVDAIDRARSPSAAPAPDRLGRRARGLARLRRAARRRPATARSRRTRRSPRRPDAPVLHERHGQLPEDGPPAGLLRARARRRRRASGTTCGPATGTGRSPTPAGRRRPGAGSSGSATSARPWSRSRSASPTPTRSCRSSRRRGITSFCAPPTLYRLLVQADFSEHDLSRAAPLHERRRAAEPGGHPGLEGGHGRPRRSTTATARPRPRCWSPTTAAVPVRPGSMGKPVPGLGGRGPRRGRARAREDDVVGNIAVRARRPAADRPVLRVRTATPRRTPTHSATAGTTRATRRGATATATCGSRAATTT